MEEVFKGRYCGAALASGRIAPSASLVKGGEAMTLRTALSLEAEWAMVPPAVFPHEEQHALAGLCELPPRTLQHPEEDDETLLDGAEPRRRVLRRVPPERGVPAGPLQALPPEDEGEFLSRRLALPSP